MCKIKIPMQTELALSLADIGDAESINALINQAYRGSEGWTRETEIVSGERSSVNDITKLIHCPDSHLLVATISGILTACICVENKNNKAYIGTFAVSPAFQNKGIGKHLLLLAEEYATNQLGSKKLIMAVISQREELISFYERRGYTRTGEISEYPIHLNVGIPKVENLTIEYLEKNT